MKSKMLSAAVFLLFSLASTAQMQQNTVDDYIKCIKACEGLPNSGEVQQCIEGCKAVIKCPNVGVKILDRAPQLLTAIASKQTKNGEVLIHADKAANFFVDYRDGKLSGYTLKSKGGGSTPLPIVSYPVGKTKRYFIFSNKGKLYQVRKPDVQWPEISGKTS